MIMTTNVIAIKTKQGTHLPANLMILASGKPSKPSQTII